jgi:hypothetical protein
MLMVSYRVNIQTNVDPSRGSGFSSLWLRGNVNKDGLPFNQPSGFSFL